jgi:hypothetical protein
VVAAVTARPAGARPEALDLFCCSGGATRGLQRAGFRVRGVDKMPRPNYCGDDFVQADALTYLRDLIRTGEIHRFALVGSSPPCQERCTLRQGTNLARGWGGDHEQLVPATRELLLEAGVPFYIEQPSNHGGLIRTDLMLCTDMFDLGPPPWVQRHRDFELHGFTATQPPHPAGPVRGHRGYVRGYRGKNGNRPGFFRDGPYVAPYGNGGGKATIAEMQHALGIDWTNVRDELTEAIPPAYTQHIAHEFLSGLSRSFSPETITVQARYEQAA